MLPNAANPVELYRGAAGVNKDDDTSGARNSQNLEAGRLQPYPNLGTVPAPPDRAMSGLERKELEQGLAADRDAAKRTDAELRTGHASGAAAPDAAGTPATDAARALARPDAPRRTASANPPSAAKGPQHRPGSEPAPQESALTTPAVSRLPKGDTPHSAPPPPKIPPVAKGQKSPGTQIAKATPGRAAPPADRTKPEPPPIARAEPGPAAADAGKSAPADTTGAGAPAPATAPSAEDATAPSAEEMAAAPPQPLSAPPIKAPADAAAMPEPPAAKAGPEEALPPVPPAAAATPPATASLDAPLPAPVLPPPDAAKSSPEQMANAETGSGSLTTPIPLPGPPPGVEPAPPAVPPATANAAPSPVPMPPPAIPGPETPPADMARAPAAEAMPPSNTPQPSPGPVATGEPTRPGPIPEAPKPPGDQLAMVAPPPPPPPPPAAQPAVGSGLLRGGKGPIASIQVAEIEFAPGVLTLTADDNRRLADAVKVYEMRGGIIRVVGYGRRGYGADAAQQELASFSKAIERANVVARTLAQLGLPSNKIVVQAAPIGDGLGEDRAEVLLEN